QYAPRIVVVDSNLLTNEAAADGSTVLVSTGGAQSDVRFRAILVWLSLAGDPPTATIHRYGNVLNSSGTGEVAYLCVTPEAMELSRTIDPDLHVSDPFIRFPESGGQGEAFAEIGRASCRGRGRAAGG